MNLQNRLLLLVCLFLTNFTFTLTAQDEPDVDWEDFEADIDNVFSQLDMSDVTSGLLLDRNLTFLNIHDYTGTGPLKDGNLCTPDKFGYLYATLYGMNLSPATQLPDPQTAYSETMDALEDGDAVPLGLLLYDYHKLKENVIDDNILQWQNDRLVPGSNTSVSAFEEKRVFAVTGLAETFDDLSVTFTLDNSFLFTNYTDISTIEFNDGSGWETVTFGQDFTADFPGYGGQTVEIRLSLTDGTTLTSHFSVVLHGTLEQTFGDNPDAEHFIFPTGAHSGGNVQIFYNCPDEAEIRKPLIILDAFDPTDEEDFNSRFRAKLTNVILPDEQVTLLEKIENEGYDIVYLDYLYGADDMRRNAQLVKDLLAYVNERKILSGSEEPNIMFGPSMGGTIAKIALLEMDRDGEAHDVEKLIALDAQFSGANLNLATQAMVYHVVKMRVRLIPLRWFVGGLRKLDRIMNRPATRQLLLYHHWESDLVSPEHEEFLQFYQDLDASVPKADRNFEYAVISNGSLNGNTTAARQTCSPGDKLFEINMSLNEYLENLDDIDDLTDAQKAAKEAKINFNPCDPSLGGAASTGGLSGFLAGVSEFVLFAAGGNRVKIKFEAWALTRRAK